MVATTLILARSAQWRNRPESGFFCRTFEDKNVVHRFRSNEVRLWLSLMAYNLGNLWRRVVLPKRIDNWSLTSLQQRLVKTGGRLVKHARYWRRRLAAKKCNTQD